MSVKVLLLGATGFIGKNLAQRLADDVRYALFAPTRADLNLLDGAACGAYLARLQPDYVIHCAVDIASVERSLQSFFNILNHASCFGHLIQIGSGAEYDRRVCPPQAGEAEFGKSIPVDGYGMTKYVIARELEALGPRKATNYRLFGVFGPYEDVSRRFISNNIVRVMNGLPISVNQDVVFDYVDVRDFCRFLLDQLSTLALREVSYNFCSGQPMCLSDIGQLIKDKMRVCQAVVVNNSHLGREYSGSSAKLFSEVGEFEFRTMKTSVSDLVDYYAEHMTPAMAKSVTGAT